MLVKKIEKNGKNQNHRCNSKNHRSEQNHNKSRKSINLDNLTNAKIVYSTMMPLRLENLLKRCPSYRLWTE